jgi:GNAT superfamily N-acetyltransferase
LADFNIRTATVADMDVIIHHRRAMFEDMGTATPEGLDRMVAVYPSWLQHRLASGEYVGFFAVKEGVIAGGAGLWFLDWTPHPLNLGKGRGYILNVYTEKDYRRQGVAKLLMEHILGYCHTGGVYTVTLHASKFGEPLYRALGFQNTNEMRLNLEP